MALIKCEECGKMISDKAQKCPQCGCPVTKQDEKIICPECGCEVSKNDTKCTNCGYPIPDFVNTTANQGHQKTINRIDNQHFSSVYNQGDNDSNRRAFWGFCTALALIYFILTFGANGNTGDFCQKYAQKHGYSYSNLRDFVFTETNMFPYPHQVYYFRLEDGSREEVGSYAFWTYTLK